MCRSSILKVYTLCIKSFYTERGVRSLVTRKRNIESFKAQVLHNDTSKGPETVCLGVFELLTGFCHVDLTEVGGSDQGT